MFQKTLSLATLSLSTADVYGQMGYGTQLPDDRTAAIVERMLAEAASVVRPRFCFTVLRGTVVGQQVSLYADTDGAAGVEPSATTTLNVGAIIARELHHSEAFALFVATAGREYDAWRQQGDVVADYVADAIGSAIAERCADALEQTLQATVDKLGWHHTNRFSPGYCTWATDGQRQLFSMIGVDRPCDVTLTDSAMMVPVKSVSGIIGLGTEVSRRDYACRLCNYVNCFKRRLAPQ
jgi:cobalamin-dependent methionine synthase I